MRKREIKQGEIYMINLDKDSVDSEQSKIRPCLVVSTTSLNSNRSNVIIVPITGSTQKKDMINHYCLFKDKYDWFTRKNNIVLLECVRDISVSRLERFVGEIDKIDLDRILDLIIYDFKEFSY